MGRLSRKQLSEFLRDHPRHKEELGGKLKYAHCIKLVHLILNNEQFTMAAHCMDDPYLNWVQWEWIKERFAEFEAQTGYKVKVTGRSGGWLELDLPRGNWVDDGSYTALKAEYDAVKAFDKWFYQTRVDYRAWLDSLIANPVLLEVDEQENERRLFRYWKNGGDLRQLIGFKFVLQDSETESGQRLWEITDLVEDDEFYAVRVGDQTFGHTFSVEDIKNRTTPMQQLINFRALLCDSYAGGELQNRLWDLLYYAYRDAEQSWDGYRGGFYPAQLPKIEDAFKWALRVLKDPEFESYAKLGAIMFLYFFMEEFTIAEISYRESTRPVYKVLPWMNPRIEYYVYIVNNKVPRNKQAGLKKQFEGAYDE